MSGESLIYDYFDRYPHVLATLTATAISFPLGTVAVPAMLGGLLSNIKTKSPATFSVKLKVVIVLSIVALLYGISIMQQKADIHLNTTFRTEVRREILRRIMQSRAYRFRSVDIPETIYKLLEIPYSLCYMLKLLKDITPGVMTMMGVLIYFIWISAKISDPKISFTIIGSIIITWTAAVYNANKSLPSLIDQTIESERLYNRCGDVLEVLPHTLAVGARAEEGERHSVLIGNHLENVRETNTKMVRIQAVTVGVLLTSVVFIFGLLWHAYAKGKMDTGTFTGAIFVLMSSRSIMWSLVNSMNPMLREYAFVKYLNQYFGDLDIDIESSGAMERDAIQTIPTCITPHLEFKNVMFGYSPQHTILNDVSFELKANTRTLIKGPVGSGKSTIGLLTLGLQQPTSGNVLVCGHDINQLSRKGISNVVSLIPALPALLNRTVRENMTYGFLDKNLSDHDITTALTTVGLDISLDRSVGHRGGELSTGQRKLIYLAKSLLQNTPIIIVDELTANLDPNVTVTVLESLEKIAQGKVLIFVSHDPPTTFKFDHTLTMVNNGKIEFK
jgi:ABC-type multidrug transport system fused ATPase/permease subunit